MPPTTTSHAFCDANDGSSLSLRWNSTVVPPSDDGSSRRIVQLTAQPPKTAICTWSPGSMARVGASEGLASLSGAVPPVTGSPPPTEAMTGMSALTGSLVQVPKSGVTAGVGGAGVPGVGVPTETGAATTTRKNHLATTSAPLGLILRREVRLDAQDPVPVGAPLNRHRGFRAPRPSVMPASTSPSPSPTARSRRES